MDTSDFVEISPGRFIEKKEYDHLVNVLKVEPKDVPMYLSNRLEVSRKLSLVKKPLKFQEKIV